MQSSFQPFQLGFVTAKGCETIIHTTRTFIEQERVSNNVLIKIDYKNAPGKIIQEKNN